MKKHSFVILFSAASFAFAASAQSPNSDQLGKATPQQQLRQKAFELAPIKSATDLKNYMIMTPNRVSPLRYLPTQARETFLGSLTFNEKGLTGYNYKILQDSLTPNQTSQVLALFGQQHLTDLTHGKPINQQAAQPGSLLPTLKQDILRNGDVTPAWYYDPEGGGGTEGGGTKGYWCSSRATCSPKGNDICTSNC
jgi:hypothetical protein